MVKKNLITLSLSIIFLLGSSLSPVFASTSTVNAPNFTKYGFPSVLKTDLIPAGGSGVVTYRDIKVIIPSGAFTQSVKFELLMGKDSTFIPLLPSTDKLVTNFAFEVVNTSNGQLIGTFNKPVLFEINSPLVNKSTVYYNVSATMPNKLSLNPIAATIKGTLFTHGNAVSTVGWVVATPTSTLSKTVINNSSMKNMKPVTHVSKTSHSSRDLLIAIIVLVLIVLGYVIFKKKNSANKS